MLNLNTFAYPYRALVINFERLVACLGYIGFYIKIRFPQIIMKKELSLVFNPVNANPIKWLNTLKQFVGLGLKGLKFLEESLYLENFEKASMKIPPCLF